MENIRFEKRELLKPKPDESTLGFGKTFTDYMLLMNYSSKQGWHDARIVPYGPLTLDPSTTSLHYGQLIFEGMKAYKNNDGKVVMFRPKDNLERMSRSGARLCMPPLDVDFTLRAIRELITIEKDWIPTGDATSLYVRPFMMATDEFIGVHPSDEYLFITILSPVGTYYKEGVAPIRIFVEDEYARSGPGGTGFTKCAGNYAASLLSQKNANEQGFAQVLWLDGKEHKYIEEIGTTNAFFVIDGEVITPPLDNGTILPGITRDSTIKLLRSLGHKVSERALSIDELYEAYKNGKLDEAFATGTAAVVSPIGELKWHDESMFLSGGKTGEVAQKLYDELTAIQLCKRDDPFDWVYFVD